MIRRAHGGGANENTNRLLRHNTCPRKQTCSLHTQEELDEIALRLNQRPAENSGVPNSR